MHIFHLIKKGCRWQTLFPVFFLLLNFNAAKAQDAVDHTGSFLFTGASMDIPNSNKFIFYYGYSPSDDYQSMIFLPFFRITKNIQLMPAYMMTKADGFRVFTNVQHHLLPSVILNFKLGKKFTLTNRMMYYRLLREDAKDVSLYRNRLGLIYHTQLFKKPTTLFAHDAMFWNLDGGDFIRNRVILGGSIKAAKWITPQVWYVLQDDAGILPQHQLYLILTVPLENFGVFNSKRKDKK